MSAAAATGPVPVGREALDIVMPMHLILGRDGVIRHAGPTLARLRPAGAFENRLFSEMFEVRRPRTSGGSGFAPADGARLHLQFRDAPRTSLKGVAVSLPEADGYLINISFGIDVIEAVRDYDLTASDFAATDLAIEMLYLVEAKSAAMEESRNLNLRLQRAKMAAEEQAFTDPLTGVRNRRALDQMMARMIGSGSPFTLMHLDLDYFKEVNDTLGHAAGDHVLCTVAELLRREVRGDDTIARLGGDEFVIVLNGMIDPEQVDYIAHRFIEQVEQPIPWEGTECHVSTSIGSTISRRYAKPRAEQMHRDADAALYASKRVGRGRHTIATEDLALEAMPPERRVVTDTPSPASTR